jgi:hypothetical protein
MPLAGWWVPHPHGATAVNDPKPAAPDRPPPVEAPLKSPMPHTPAIDKEEPEQRQELDIPSAEGSTERSGAAQRRQAPRRRGRS